MLWTCCIVDMKMYVFNLSFFFFFFLVQLANKYWAPHVKKTLSFDVKVIASTGILLRAVKE